jgi:hypothetical protein
MRFAAWMLAALMALPGLMYGGTYCAPAATIANDCCGPNCPAGAPLTMVDCCQASKDRVDGHCAAVTGQSRLPLFALSAAPILPAIAAADTRSNRPGPKPQSRSDPLSLLCSRQI